MYFCNKLCMYCDEESLIPVNFTAYHRVCLLHASELLNQSLHHKCSKCLADVMIVKEILTKNYEIHLENQQILMSESHNPRISSNYSENPNPPSASYINPNIIICPNCNMKNAKLISKCDHIVCKKCKGSCTKCNELKKKKSMNKSSFNWPSLSAISGCLFRNKKKDLNKNSVCKNCDIKGTDKEICQCGKVICVECLSNCKRCNQNPNLCRNCRSLCNPRFHFSCGDKGCYNCYEKGCREHKNRQIFIKIKHIKIIYLKHQFQRFANYVDVIFQVILMNLLMAIAMSVIQKNFFYKDK